MTLSSVFERLTGNHQFTGEDEQARGRVMVWLFPAGLFVCVVSAVAYAALGNWVECGTSLGGLALLVGTLVAWRRTASFALTANIVCTCHTILWTVIGYQTHDLSALSWLAFGPLIAFFLAGSRVGIWWLVVSMGLAGWLLVLAVLSPIEVTSLLPQATRTAILIPTLAVMGLLTQLSRERAMRELGSAGQRAADANAAKSRFLASISHEIRTPLNGILGTCELALLEELPARTREHLQVIESSGAMLLALINDLLDLSKAEAGRLEMAAHAFRLDTLVTEVLALHQARAQTSNTPLRSRLELPAELSLQADSVRLRQVLHNLIGNALKFGAGKPVELVARATPEGESWRLVISVTDQGRGMTAEEAAELFKPFTQLRIADSRLGTGLGLAISSTLVAQMGGTLSVISTPGEGSTFTVQLDLARAVTPTPIARPAVEVTALPRRRVLVVDDNAINLRVAAGLLERLGQLVTTASSGTEALDVLSQQAFDLVLMDLHMPDLKGTEVTRRVRERERSQPRQTPIVALTASALASELAECRSAGMDETLTKPVQLEHLRTMLVRFPPSVSDAQVVGLETRIVAPTRRGHEPSR
jgi:signal transduction histidine kinase/CheY-like chemotaxis protein